MPVMGNKNAAVEDYVIKSQRLCIPFAVVASATPANKTNSNDLPQAMVLALQGQTAAAAAIDSLTNFTTPNDASGVFGILLCNIGTVQKVHNVSVYGLSSGTMTFALVGASSTGVTAAGNIAVSATWSGNLSTTNLSGTLHVDYIIDKTKIPAIE